MIFYRFLSLLFLNSDFSVTIYVIEMILSVCAHKVPLEGSVSQNLNIGPSYYFMSKNGKLFVNFFQIYIFSISTFHKIKTKTYIKILRHPSLHPDLMNAHSKIEQDK